MLYNNYSLEFREGGGKQNVSVQYLAIILTSTRIIIAVSATEQIQQTNKVVSLPFRGASCACSTSPSDAMHVVHEIVCRQFIINHMLNPFNVQSS